MGRKPPPRAPVRAPPPAPPRKKPVAPTRSAPVAPPRIVPAAPPRKPPPHANKEPRREQRPSAPPLVPAAEDGSSLPLLSKGPRRPFKDLSRDSLMGNGMLGPPDVRPVPWKTSPHDLLNAVTVVKGCCYRAPEGLGKYGTLPSSSSRKPLLELEYASLLDDWSKDDAEMQQRKAKIASFGRQHRSFANELPESYPKQVQTLAKLDWLRKLACTTQPLDQLAQAVPLYPRHQYLDHLVKEKVPIQRALWFVKVIHVNSGSTQHKTPEDMSRQWWEILRNYLDNFLKPRQLASGDARDWVGKWRYVIRLAHASCAEALLDCRSLVCWLVNALLNGAKAGAKAGAVVALVAHSLLWFEDGLAREPKLAMELHVGLVKILQHPVATAVQWSASAHSAAERLIRVMAAADLLPHALVSYRKQEQPVNSVMLHCSAETQKAVEAIDTRAAVLRLAVSPSGPINIATLLDMLAVAVHSPNRVTPEQLVSAVQPLVDDDQLQEYTLTVLCCWCAQLPLAAHRIAMTVKVMLQVLTDSAAPAVQRVLVPLLESAANNGTQFAHLIALAQGLADSSCPELLSQDAYARFLISRPQNQRNSQIEYTVLSAFPLSASEDRYRWQHCQNQRRQLLAERRESTEVAAGADAAAVTQFHHCLLNVARVLDKAAGGISQFRSDLLARGLPASEEGTEPVQLDQMSNVLLQLPLFYKWQVHQWLTKVALRPAKRTPSQVKIVLMLLLESGQLIGAAKGFVAAIQSVHDGTAPGCVLPQVVGLLQESVEVQLVLHSLGLLPTVVMVLSERYTRVGCESHELLQLLITFCQRTPGLLEVVSPNLRSSLEVLSKNSCTLSSEEFKRYKQQDVNAQISALFQSDDGSVEAVVQHLLNVMSCAQDLGLAIRLCLSKLVTSKNAANLVERCGRFLELLQVRVVSTSTDWQQLPHAPIVLAVVRHVVLPMANNATLDDTKETAGIVTKLLDQLSTNKYLDADMVAQGLVAPALTNALAVRDAAVYGPLCTTLCARMLTAAPGEPWAVQQQESLEALAIAATKALKLTKDAATNITQAQSHPRWTKLRESIFCNSHALQCVLCSSPHCWIELGLIEPREAITKLLNIPSANVTSTAVLSKGLQIAATAWRASEACTPLHMAILYAPQFGVTRATAAEADQTAAELLIQIQQQIARGNIAPSTAAELCQQLCSRDQRVVEKLQDVLLSKPSDSWAQLACTRGVSEAVLRAEWLEWASACAARVAKNQDVSIMMARGLANQLQQLVEEQQQPHVHSADAIQDISRLLHLASPLHDVYCQMPSKCKCDQLVFALLHLLPNCLQNTVVAQLVHDLVVSIYTHGDHLYEHTARWREVAGCWHRSEDLLLRHLHVLFTPRSVLKNGHDRFLMFPEPANWMAESVEIASRNNTWQVLPGYPYRNDGIAVIVHQNKLKRKWDQIYEELQDTSSGRAQAEPL